MSASSVCLHSPHTHLIRSGEKLTSCSFCQLSCIRRSGDGDGCACYLNLALQLHMFSCVCHISSGKGRLEGAVLVFCLFVLHSKARK